VQNFGEPFFLVVRENETLTEVKLRIQKKLVISDEEFSKVIIDPIHLPSLSICTFDGMLNQGFFDLCSGSLRFFH